MTKRQHYKLDNNNKEKYERIILEQKERIKIIVQLNTFLSKYNYLLFFFCYLGNEWLNFF